MKKSIRKSVVFEALMLLKEDPINSCLIGYETLEFLVIAGVADKERKNQETLDFLVEAKVIEANDNENGYYNYRLTEAGNKLLHGPADRSR